MKTYPIIRAALLAAAVVGSAAAPAGTGQPAVEGTQGYRDELRRPPEPWKGKPRSGKQVYEYRCKACHARSTQGAPMPDDDLEWGRRAQQGIGVLVKHAIEGYRQQLMPPRGGCRNCSDAEVEAAVRYMLKRSGVKVGR